MASVLILGGGFGGLAAAHSLRRLLPDSDEIYLVDRSPTFVIGFRKTWAVVGHSTLEEGTRALDSLQSGGVTFIQGSVDSIDPEGLAAVVDGNRIEADAMVVALGAALDRAVIPGLEAHALDFYDPASVPAAQQAIDAFEGGTVLIGIFGEPYKCPPAPYELALLLQETFHERGVPANLEVFTPKPMSLPILGEAGCSIIESRLEANGVHFLPNHRPISVETGAVRFSTARRSFDLLIGVPPHKVPNVVQESGLTGEHGWVEVNPLTLATRFEQVYAIGDVTQLSLADGKPHPKAGIFAEAMAEVAASHIAARLKGGISEAVYSGEGHCFLEMGRGQAALVRGRFMAKPAPEVELTEPSEAFFEAKMAFERERLARWFPG